MSCPSCGAETVSADEACPSCGCDLRTFAADASPLEWMARFPAERRRDTRLDISVDMVLGRLSRGGTVLQEERTVANNVARHGARVLTSMAALAADDLVVIQEVGTDFRARSAVRYATTGKDNIRRIGVEFLDRTAPGHLLPTDTLATRAPRPSTAIRSDSTGATPISRPRTDRRLDARFDISVEVFIWALGSQEAVLWEERTVAEDFGPRGARVRTAMTGLSVGDTVSLREVGGDFQTRSAVRSVRTGDDGVRRLGLQFLDQPAPRRLVPNSAAPRRELHPRAEPQPATPPPFVPAPSPAAMGPPGTASHGADISGVRDAPYSEAVHRAEQAYSEGRRQLAEGKPWDAIQFIEAGLVFAKGTEIHRRLRVLLAQALAWNPRWLKRSEETLLGVIREDPEEVEAYVALGVLYRTVGINSRARAMMTKAVGLDPRHPQAAAELRALGAADD